jgi:hypothetical protein
VPPSEGEDDALELLVWLKGEAVQRSGNGGDTGGFCACGLGLVGNAVRFHDLGGFNLK